MAIKDSLENHKQPDTLEELVLAWRHSLDSLKNKDDQKAAKHLVGSLAGNNHWDEWYESKTADPIVTEVFDLAANLELPNGVAKIGTNKERKAAWQRVNNLVSELEEKYLHKST